MKIRLLHNFIREHKENNKTVGVVKGVFDILHVDHILFLKKAKLKCDILIVLLIPDDDVMKIKKKKPINTLRERIEILSSIKYVNYCASNYLAISPITKKYDPLIDFKILDKLAPDYLFVNEFNFEKLNSFTMKNVKIIKIKEGIRKSTTKIINIILNSYDK